MELIDKAREVFANDLFATRTTGISIVSVGNHRAECSMALDGRHRNAKGAAMGGAIYTLADFATAVAANSDSLDEDSLHWVSLNATVHYLAPAVGACLTARAEALKVGRTTALYQATVTAAVSGRTVAIVESTMMRV